MAELVAMIQTTWPNIRVCLYRRDDGRIEFCEEGVSSDKDGDDGWKVPFSGLFQDVETAKAAMIDYYCNSVEDEYTVDPESVTILYPPDFKGPHHPVLRVHITGPKTTWHLRDMKKLGVQENTRDVLYRSPEDLQLWVLSHSEDAESFLTPITSEDAILRFPDAEITT
jgi:hypothetical protein